ncbi:MAG: FprA family A-type flavoprotein [Spirochaetes bacterium]|nr:FprA family A-type flavoprotein [Spirochaetota bacterium]
MIKEIKPGVFTVGAVHWDRRLFDELIPLPDGTSYNAYLIKGKDKNVLIDTVDPDKEDELFSNLKMIGVDKIDYIISNHAEQDHSGTLPKLLSLHPEAKIITNSKCKDFLSELLLLPDEKFHVVNDGESFSIGNKTFEFILAPWVHWPETMLTYLKEDKILFSCDMFGSHMATSETFVTDEARVYESAKRYYAEIMMPFRSNIQGHMEKIGKLKIDIIAPSHGPVYDRPEFICNAYRDWISDDVKNIVVLPYVSMHHSTKKMVDHLIDALAGRGIVVKPFNLTVTDIGQLAISIVDAATIVLATPTVLTGPHPSAVYAAYLVNALKPKTRFLSVIGSFGWGGRTVDIISEILKNVKAEMLDPVIIKGYPKEDDFKTLDALAERIMKKHKEMKIL